jgi:phosphate acetyltransferase
VKIKSLYIAAKEKNAGSLFISMGMMEVLKKNLQRVAFFRPVIYKKTLQDGDISFILERYKLDMEYEECFGFDVAEVSFMVSQGRKNELIEKLIEKFQTLKAKYDFVLCEGIRHSFLPQTLDFDLNMVLSKNFNAPFINVINAKGRNTQEIFEDVVLEKQHATKEGCLQFATIINRVEYGEYEQLNKKLATLPLSCYLLEEIEELNLRSVEDIVEGLDAKKVVFGAYDNARVVRNVKVAALSLDNFLSYLQEDDLVIVPADRSEIVLGIFSALHSKNYPNISAIIFPFDGELHPNITKIIEGLAMFQLPILRVKGDSFTTANEVMKLHARLRVSNERKIALALGLFHKRVDTAKIEQKIAQNYHAIVTPQMFEYKLFAMATRKMRTIVLPEAEDERVLRAAEIILRRGVAKIIFLANKEELSQRALGLGLDIAAAEVVDMCNTPLMEEFVEKFYNLRKAKGLTRKGAQDALLHKNYFATMMVHLGYADGMVSGAMHSTADTLRPALQIIKTRSDVSLVSSIFFMCFDTKVLVYGDCALNQDPTASELADIAIASAMSAKLFDIEPKVAMLSYSTGESGHGDDVDKVREATQIIKQKAPSLLVEGPIQYDAAINKEVAKLKLPHSKVAGEASVFIFPDLNTGNNTYKAVQRSSGAVAIGPVMQGLKKPVNDLSRGCEVVDIVNTIAITAIQAGECER